MATPQNVGSSGCFRKSTNATTGQVSISAATGQDGICPGTLSANGHYQCCGQGATCLANGICHTTSTRDGGTGFYISDCTDRSYSDTAACSPQCANQALPAITYIPSMGVWACCGTDAQGHPACSNPTNFTFSAPTPDYLLKTSSDNSTSSTASSAAATKTGTAAGSKKSTSGLAGGAIAGIVIGALLLIALVIGAVWFMRRRKKQSKAQTAPIARQEAKVAEMADTRRERPSELDGAFTARHEAYTPHSGTGKSTTNTDTTRHELE